MAADKLQVQLDQLRALRADPQSPSTLDALRAALARGGHHAVAAAARHISDFGLRALGADLARAYARIAEGQGKADPGCVAKQALIEALSSFDHPDPAPFLHAFGVVQWEKSWGPPVDSAANLRGHALMGLVGLGTDGTPERIATLLADREPRARSAAARCAVSWGDPTLARALLLLRVLAGEDDPEVLGDCMESLVAAGGSERVIGFLEGASPRAEAAALALGAARAAEAVPALIAWSRGLVDPSARKVAWVALGLTRQGPALEFLLEQLGESRGRTARDALEALRVFLADPAARPRVVEAAARAGLSAALDELEA